MTIKNYILFGLLSFTSVMLFSTCNDNEVTPREYPRVKTLDVNEITSSGARFNAEIIFPGNGKIIEYGFVWDKSENPTIESSEKKILAQEISTGGFTSKISTTLEEGAIYYVRAYAKNDEYLVYGKNVSFESLGSGAPIIADFEPKQGTGGDTIRIVGENFSFQSSSNKVSFDQYESSVIWSTDTLLLCVAPKNVPSETTNIKIQIAGNQATTSREEFTFLTPKIISFSPIQGTFGDIVTIHGYNFNLRKEENIVMFEDAQAIVLSASNNSLTVSVPEGITKKLNKISVTVNLRTGQAENVYNIIPPSIEYISPASQYINSTFNIKGNNFNPMLNGNKVILGNVQGQVLDATKTNLVVQINDSVYTSRSFPVEVRVAEQSVYSVGSLVLLDRWLRKAPAPEGADYQSTPFSSENAGYILLRGSKEIWKYDPKVNKWKQLSNFPGAARYNAFSFTIDNFAYIGGGYNINSQLLNDVWKYNFNADSWSQVSSIPIDALSSVGLSFNNKGYVCTNASTANFIEYNPNTNDWTELPDLITAEHGARGIADAGFTIGDKIYIYVSGNSTGLHQLYEFNTSTSSWSQKADMIDFGIRTDLSGFTSGNKGYIIGRYLIHEYDNITDTWRVVDDKLNYTTLSGYRGVLIDINGIAYFKNGFDDEFWEYNPYY